MILICNMILNGIRARTHAPCNTLLVEINYISFFFLVHDSLNIVCVQRLFQIRFRWTQKNLILLSLAAERITKLISSGSQRIGGMRIHSFFCYIFYYVRSISIVTRSDVYRHVLVLDTSVICIKGRTFFISFTLVVIELVKLSKFEAYAMFSHTVTPMVMHESSVYYFLVWYMS